MLYLVYVKNPNGSITMNSTFNRLSGKVEKMTYYGYTLAQAKKRHREKFGLKNKHIRWYDVNEILAIQNSATIEYE